MVFEFLNLAVTVYIKYYFADYVFTKELCNVDTVVGQLVILTCEVSKEGGELKWLKSGELIEISNTKKYEFCSEGNVHSLKIYDVTFEYEAEYRCCYGDAVTSCMVFVDGMRNLHNDIFRHEKILLTH